MVSGFHDARGRKASNEELAHNRARTGRVVLEACGITTRMMKADNAKLVKGVQPVANTFNSLIGYQSKGYALIPVF